MIAALGLYRRELGRLCTGSGATIALPFGLAWVAWQRYYGHFDTGAVDAVDHAFRLAALMLVPLAVWLSAPALAAERSEGTSVLWAISPVRPIEVVLGKFCAIMTFMLAAIVLLLLPVVWDPAFAQVAVASRVWAGILGMLLICTISCSVTLLASTLANHFSTAFGWGLGVLVVWIWSDDVLIQIVDVLTGLFSPGAAEGEVAGSLFGLGGKNVLFPLFVGWVDLAAVTGLVGAVVLTLVTAHQVVASERWRN